MKKIVINRINDEFWEKPAETILDVVNIKFDTYTVTVTTVYDETVYDDEEIIDIIITDNTSE